MPNNTIIKAHHLTKVYKLYDKPIDRLKEALHPMGKMYHQDFYALNDLSFEIKRGETVGVIGKNGSGKSTLLKIIAGITTPSSGHIHVGGKVSALLELGAGFNPEMTGIENIYLKGALMGFTTEEIDNKLDNILAFADIGRFINQKVKTYSSGMFARLAFAAGINVDPEILIVDEVLSVGDALFRRKCYAKMESMCNDGLTVLFVSHSDNAIASLCQSAIFLSNGHLVSQGITSTILKEYNQSLIKQNSNFDKSSDIRSSHPQIVQNASISIQDISIQDTNKIKTTILEHGKEYTIFFTITSQAIYQNLECAFAIRTLQGIVIAGGQISQNNNGNLAITPNNPLTISFTIKNLLSSGEYYLTLNIRQWVNGHFQILTKHYDVYNFQSIETTSFKNFQGYVNIIQSIKVWEDIPK